MSFIEIAGQQSDLDFRQRWSHYFVLIFALVAFFIGLNLRDSALNATTGYVNPEAGIRAFYPANWLIDSEGDYVFRVRNLSEAAFPTTIQVSVQPVGTITSPRYIIDALTLNRAQTLPSYDVQSAGLSVALPDETEGTAIHYTFVARGNDPFLQSVPVVVRGLDILTIRRGQIIMVTFRSNAATYEQNYSLFEQFMNSLEF